MRAFVDGLQAIHSASRIYGGKGEYVTQDYQTGHHGTRVKTADIAEQVTEHPVARTHPETGRKGLYVNSAFTVGIKGMAEGESRPILEYLYRHSDRPAFTCRFGWAKGEITFRNVGADPPYGLNDYPGRRPGIRRCTTACER